MPLDANLAAAEAAIAYVAQCGVTSSNKISHRIRASGGADAVVGTNQGTRSGNYGVAGAQVHNVRLINQNARGYGDIARTTIARGYGNCGELAIIAGIHMHNAGSRPVHLMHFTATGYDHMWAVVGLDVGWQPHNMRSWGREAVWVDPWQQDAGVFFSITDFVAGRVRNLNAIYKCDSVERVEAGAAAAIPL